jgi:hypothetical protein
LHSLPAAAYGRSGSSAGRAKLNIVRAPFAIALALLAAAPAAAVPPPKPPAPGGDPDRDAWRAHGLAICVSEMQPAEGASPVDVRATCGCALDRFAAANAAPPAIDSDLVRTELGTSLVACAAEQRPMLAAAIARRLAEAGLSAVPSGDAKPAETQTGTPPPTPTAEPPKPDVPRPGANLRSSLDGLSLPPWITDSGLPAWAWALLGCLVFLVLRGLFRSGNGRDLIGPPPNMRLGARANPPAPRRADPPQRP